MKKMDFYKVKHIPIIKAYNKSINILLKHLIEFVNLTYYMPID